MSLSLPPCWGVCIWAILALQGTPMAGSSDAGHSKTCLCKRNEPWGEDGWLWAQTLGLRMPAATPGAGGYADPAAHTIWHALHVTSTGALGGYGCFTTLLAYPGCSLDWAGWSLAPPHWAALRVSVGCHTTQAAMQCTTGCASGGRGLWALTWCLDRAMLYMAGGKPIIRVDCIGVAKVI